MALFATDQQATDTVGSGSVTVEQLAQMVDELFASMLGLAIDVTPHAAIAVGQSSIAATIRINGDWNATIQVLASDGLSREIARAMFGGSAGALKEAEILDALGEVVNVIGGNVKGVINQDCNLSLPCVGSADKNHLVQGDSVAFDLNGQPLTIVIAQS